MQERLKFEFSYHVLREVFDGEEGRRRLRLRLGWSPSHVDKIMAGKDPERRDPLQATMNIIDEAVLLDRKHRTFKARYIVEFIANYFRSITEEIPEGGAGRWDRKTAVNDLALQSTEAFIALNRLHRDDEESIIIADKKLGDLEVKILEARARVREMRRAVTQS